MTGCRGRFMPSLLMNASETDVVQETLLGEALEHAPVGAVVLDETGRHLAANRAACRLTGYTREELLSKSPFELAADPATVSSGLQEMAAGRLEHGTTRTRRKDGTVVEIDFRIGVTRSGGLPHYVCVFWQREPVGP
jgi:PAS domain S-box-containing protein